MGSGMNNGVLALAASGPNLYAGGYFTEAGGKASAYVARAIIGTLTGRFGIVSYLPATGCRFMFSEATLGQYYVIQTASSPAKGSWSDWVGLTYTGPIIITDPGACSAPSKFYRAVPRASKALGVIEIW